jgi:tellurite resistance-related uncharacterized protein
MERTIEGFHQDEAGDWVAELSCRHGQHIRHQPPFRLAPWVLDEEGRAARLGSPLGCPRCDRAELPEGLDVVRASDTWDPTTMPAALRRAHRVGKGVWGRLRVEHGEVRFRACTEPPLDVVVAGPDGSQAIPPEVEHEVEPSPDARFRVEFLE